MRAVVRALEPPRGPGWREAVRNETTSPGDRVADQSFRTGSIAEAATASGHIISKAADAASLQFRNAVDSSPWRQYAPPLPQTVGELMVGRTRNFGTLTMLLFAATVLVSAGPQVRHVDASMPTVTIPQKAQEIRADFGFASDVSADRSLRYDAAWGVPLTNAERSELQRRSDLQSQLDALEAELRRILGDDTFSSLHMGIKEVAPVVVSVTASAREAADVAQAMLPPGTPLEMRVVKYSARQFEQSMEAERRLFEHLRRQGVVLLQTVPNVEDNRIDVVLSLDSAADAEGIAAAALGPIARIQRTASGPVTQNDRYAAYPHVRAGVNITNLTGVRCTASFNARSATGYYYVLTAGHCTVPDDTWFNGGGSTGTGTPANYIGAVGTDRFAGGGTTDCDCSGIGPITAGQATNAVYLTATTNRNITAVAASPIRVGAPTCFSGVTSDAVVCGSQNAGYASFYYRQENQHVTYQGLTTQDSLGGDSGSPVFDGQNAFGILSGSEAMAAPSTRTRA